MKKLKCEACGAKLKMDPKDPDYAICEYCGIRYKLSEDVNINVNIDKDIKETFIEEHKMQSKIFMIVFIIAFLIIVGTSIFIFTDMGNFKGNSLNGNSSFNGDNFDNNQKEFEKFSLNSMYEFYQGTTHGSAVISLLDNVVTNNKKLDRKVVVVFKDKKVTESDDIIAMKKEIKKKTYEVILDYDEEGYVCEVKIEDIY